MIHFVKIGYREYDFDSFTEAVAFAIHWNGILLTPIESI
jgi:hypothetical protein